MHHVRRFATPTLVALVACAGCEPRPQVRRLPVTSSARAALPPASSNVAATAPATQAEAATKPVEPRKPQRVDLKWARFADAFEKESDAIITGEWTGGNRVELKTQNVRRMVIDFRELPGEGKRKGPPWNLQLDGYAIEITGRRGPKIELTHKENGGWDVTGPPPRRTP